MTADLSVGRGLRFGDADWFSWAEKVGPYPNAYYVINHVHPSLLTMRIASKTVTSNFTGNMAQIADLQIYNKTAHE